MANEKPVAVASADAALSGQQLVDVIRAVIDSQRSSNEDLAARMAQAIADATMKTRTWWNEAEFPDVSVFNPRGEKAHPRPELARDIFWLNYLCQESQHTEAEILLLNLLQPGKYHLKGEGGQIERANFFVVRERDPGVPNGPIVVEFPCKDNDDRMRLARFDRGRGMVDLLLQMLPTGTTVPEPALT